MLAPPTEYRESRKIWSLDGQPGSKGLFWCMTGIDPVNRPVWETPSNTEKKCHRGSKALFWWMTGIDRVNRRVWETPDNPKKNNHYTPGTKIKIISENKSRKLKPDYYFVLPWHFKEEILKRENKIRKKGCKFIFPLPKLKIY